MLIPYLIRSRSVFFCWSHDRTMRGYIIENGTRKSNKPNQAYRSQSLRQQMIGSLGKVRHSWKERLGRSLA